MKNIGREQKLKNIIILSDLKQGDIVTYNTGRINFVNKPYKYRMYFNENMYNSGLNLKIVKIQRYVKVLWFYKLKTIYSGESRWI